MTGIDVVTIMTTTEAIVASSGVRNIMNHLSNNKTIIHHNQDDMTNHRHGRLKHHSQYNEVGKMMWKIGLHPYVPCVNSKVTLLDK